MTGKQRTESAIRIDGDIAYVELTQGMEAMIDIADIPLVQGRCWCASYNKSIDGYYAIGSPKKGEDNLPRTIYMHRHIMGHPGGMTVDHRHHKTLDNRRSELEVLPQWRNSLNRKGLDKRNRTGGRGVYEWTSNRGITYYVARIGLQRYFPHTPEGLDQAKQAAEEMRAMLTITDDIETKES